MHNFMTVEQMDELAHKLVRAARDASDAGTAQDNVRELIASEIEAMDAPAIFEYEQATRRHPDYLFGAVFTTGDLMGRSLDAADPEYFRLSDGEDRMSERGHEFLDWHLGEPKDDEDDASDS